MPTTYHGVKVNANRTHRSYAVALVRMHAPANSIDAKKSRLVISAVNLLRSESLVTYETKDCFHSLYYATDLACNRIIRLKGISNHMQYEMFSVLNERLLAVQLFSVFQAIPASVGWYQWNMENASSFFSFFFFSRFIHAIQTKFSIQFGVSLALKFSICLLFTFGYVIHCSLLILQPQLLIRMLWVM